ncbi:hypothetical protein V2P20_02790 [Methylobacter sp. Wu1]|uniref:phage NrS-1 polymerase family protein n=1 Tax=Methylobacter sp. Wu1 TaxID=3119359 RepID=UPI002F91E95E
MINNDDHNSIALDSDFIDMYQVEKFEQQYYDEGYYLLGDETKDEYAARMMAEIQNKAAEIIKEQQQKAIAPDPLAAMKAFNQWIVWREEPNPKPDGKPIKEPKNPATGYAANAHNPRIWMSYEAAVAAAERMSKGSPKPFRVGFTFTAATKLFFFDLDNCIDTDTGEIRTEATELMDLFPGCMVERSVSGKGFHVVGTYEGDEPLHDKKADGWLELYTDKRFMALGLDDGRKGDAGMKATVELNKLIEMRFKPELISADGKEVTAEWTTEYDPKWNGFEDIDEQLTKALAAQPSNDRLMAGKASFAELHAGSNAGFPGDSEADAAYFFDLAYWFGRNCDVIEAVALSSDRARDKWEGQVYSNGDTWLRREIKAAVARQTKVYDKGFRSEDGNRKVLEQVEYLALMAEAQRKAVVDGIDHAHVDILRHVDDSHIWKRLSQHYAYLQYLPVAACKYKPQDLQTAIFSARINCQ